VIDKGYLVTIGEFRAAVALSPDLSWQLHFINLGKAKLLKKGWLVRQAKDSGNTKFLSLLEASLHQLSADALLLAIRDYRQRPYLSQVGPKNM